MFVRLACLFVLLTTLSISAHENVVRVLGPQAVEDVSQSYFVELLKSALKKGSPKQIELEMVNAENLTQGRTLNLLASEHLDVYWTGASKKREQLFHAIKIPLVKGLLGYRVSIIRNQDLAEFSTLSIKDFKQKVACQGAHWPDTKILEFNGFNVSSVVRYDLMFGMVSKKRCDYFPRAIFEGYGELVQAQKKYKNLTMSDDILLYYPLPIYFFVNKNNKKLAHVIEKGLEQMIDSGELELLMKSHKVTQYLFPLDKWKNKRVVHLSNPFLTDDIDIKNPRYWVVPSQVK